MPPHKKVVVPKDVPRARKQKKSKALLPTIHGRAAGIDGRRKLMMKFPIKMPFILNAP